MSISKVRILTDFHVVIAHADHVRSWVSLEEQAKDAERFASDLQELLRAQVNVEREFQDQCSACRMPWETMVEDGKTFCAWCGEEVTP